MIVLNQIYKCEVCGNIVSVLHGGVGELICCERPMNLQVEKSKDMGIEKHLPVIRKISGNGSDGVIVSVGEVKHPMENEHYIEWIEILMVDNNICRKFLKPGEKPEVEFHTRIDIKEVRAYCNIHGLWKIVL